MTTAILPIRIGDNSFWSSDTGLACIKRFLKMFDEAAYIDQLFVITQDLRVQEQAQRYNIKTLNFAIPGSIDRPYTFDQTMELAKNIKKNYLTSNEDIIVVDHRNLCFTLGELKKAYLVSLQSPYDVLVSLAVCRDHPCQYKSYFEFIGTSVFHRKDANSKAIRKGTNAHFISHRYRSSSNKHDEIIVTIRFKSTDYAISINNPFNGLVAHILPFTANGPIYEKFLEMYIVDPDYQTLPNLSSDSIDGVIVTMLSGKYSGSYDAVEFFTPEHADWELNPSDNMLHDKEHHHLVQGRQQFSPIYTYEGTLCVIPAICLEQDSKPTWAPFLLNQSCIVSDWIDYYSIKQ